MQRVPTDVLALVAVRLNARDTKALASSCSRWRKACEAAHPWFRAGCLKLRTIRGLYQTENVGDASRNLWKIRQTAALVADTVCDLSREKLEIEHGARKRKRPERVPCPTDKCLFHVPCTNCEAPFCDACHPQGECTSCRRHYCDKCAPRCISSCSYCAYGSCPKCTRTGTTWYRTQLDNLKVCEKCVLFRAGVKK